MMCAPTPPRVPNSRFLKQPLKIRPRFHGQLLCHVLRSLEGQQNPRLISQSFLKWRTSSLVNNKRNMQPGAKAPRPTGITFLGVLSILIGLFGTLGGAALVMSPDTVVAGLSALAFVIGLLYIAAGIGSFKDTDGLGPSEYLSAFSPLYATWRRLLLER